MLKLSLGSAWWQVKNTIHEDVSINPFVPELNAWCDVHLIVG
jgi:hypothetical protein